MKIQKITLTAMLTGIALIIFIVEMQIPSFTHIPGIKLGLANVVTLFAIYAVDRKTAMSVLFLRILTGSVVAGNISALMYSAAGGVCCFLVMSVLSAYVPQKLLWAVSVAGAIFHNAGQLAVAWLATGSTAVFVYFPPLVLSGIVTGIFTGLCAYYVLKNKHIVKILRKFQ